MPLSSPKAVVVECVRFPAGAFLLEGELAYDEAIQAPRGAVVLACSHPHLGGNLHNNVVRGLGDGLAELGFVTLRFNYRGVGCSQGPVVDVARQMAQFLETSHVPDEMDLWRDLQAAVAFLHASFGRALPLTLLGYSFGCALLPFVDVAGERGGYVLIAPPLNRHDLQALTGVRGPLLVIVSENDFTTDTGRLRQWFEELPAPKRLVEAPRDGHFFRGHERWLVDTVFAFLQDPREGIAAR
jgi:alpha/beta superfamily hydrolase